MTRKLRLEFGFNISGKIFLLFAGTFATATFTLGFILGRVI